MNLLAMRRYTARAVLLVACGFAIALLHAACTVQRSSNNAAERSPDRTDASATAASASDQKAAQDHSVSKTKAAAAPMSRIAVSAWTIFALFTAFGCAALLYADPQSPPLNIPSNLWRIVSVGGVLFFMLLSVIYAAKQLPVTYANKNTFLIASAMATVSMIALIAHHTPRAINALRNRSLFFQLSVILSVAGAGGGFAYHLVNHDGGLIVPELGEYEDVVKVKANSQMPGTSVQASPAPTSTPRAIPVKSVTRPVFNIGFLGDILLGIVAANALHVAMASLIPEPKANEPLSPKQNLTVLALGVLAGFAGASVLTSWSDKYLNSAEITALVRQEVKDQAGDKNAAGGSVAEATQVSQKVIDSLAQLQWPDNETIARMTRFLSLVKERSLDSYTVDELVASAGSDFFTRPAGTSNPEKCLLLLSQANPPPAQAWAGRMLRALVTTCNGARSSNKAWYTALQSDLTSLRSDTSSPEQKLAGRLLGDYVQYAALIGGSLQKLDVNTIEKDVLSGKEASSKALREASTVADAIKAYLLQATVPSLDVLPSEPARLIRLLLAIRAVPKEALKEWATDKNLAPVLQELTDSPSYIPNTAATATTAGPTPAAPASQPAPPTPPPSAAPSTSASPSSSASPVSTASPPLFGAGNSAEPAIHHLLRASFAEE